ncbi:MerR family transcriptional regulator [Lactobacillus sp. PV037]|uniref:MerR family transcriptional regulator n=1 Tax=unclassified Lactobacillus TaxID=2620435 RepID=UPI00223EFA57|nr:MULTISPECIES: MerR family transcriptional regulator [unclassified Lactobacillus]QNQ82262.1 MerR family transcriptional regulator [Lactobacillus sp. PV012]QNQ83627.1 MerR family transcriptional regulator [Lactobacillus sp. PV037]
MKINEISKKYNLSVDTLRYWEKVKIIPQIKRDKNGYRIYSEEDCEWIEFVHCMRNGGATIAYLKKYLSLASSKRDTRKERKKLLEKQLLNLKNQLHILQQNYDFLEHKINNWNKYFE